MQISGDMFLVLIMYIQFTKRKHYLTILYCGLRD